VAASHGLGVALMPPLLIESELARGELVLACTASLQGERGYYLVTPAQDDPPVLTAFRDWLMGQVAQAGGVNRLPQAPGAAA